MAEDDAEVRSLIQIVGRRCSCDVETAANGLETLEKLRSGRYDILLLDLMMPVVSGYDVLPQLREMKHRPMVIVITAMTTQRYLELDPAIVTTIIRKPFDIEMLTDILGETAERMARERSVEEQASIPSAT